MGCCHSQESIKVQSKTLPKIVGKTTREEIVQSINIIENKSEDDHITSKGDSCPKVSNDHYCFYIANRSKSMKISL